MTLNMKMPAGYKGSKYFPIKLTFTCSKSTVETLEKGVKYVQS